MGVSSHTLGKHSGLPGDSATWAVGGPWSLSLGEASHVYQCVGDYAGLDGGVPVPISDDVVGSADDDAVGQTSV